MTDSGEAAYQVARATAAGFAVALAFALERWRPHAPLRPAWRINLGLWAIDSVAMAIVCGACGWHVASWAASEGLGLLAFAHAPGWLAVAIGVLGLDAVSYAWHRANHRLPLLWRFHRVHHQDRNFHFTTALRFHPGELLLALPVRLAAVILFGVPPEGVLVFEMVFAVANLLEHGNFDLSPRLEPAVERVFVTPALHRAHHASDWRELDLNFGTVFSFWDRFAGTFNRGAPGRRIATGLPDDPGLETKGLAASLLLPFRGRPPTRPS